MAILRALMFALLSLAGIATAQAASFDCAKARTGVEKAVCADPKLSEYDERIAAARPDLATDLRMLSQRFSDWRYADAEPGGRSARALTRALRAHRPPANSPGERR